MKKWYIILISSTLLLIIYIVYMFTDIGNGILTNEMVGENELPIPSILKDSNPDEGVSEFNLTVQKGSTEFIKNIKTSTYGYNGSYLGPVLRVNRGDYVKINVKNKLDEPTTVHWHGFEIPGEMDGGPHQDIMPDLEWNPQFVIDQPAATLWYHPHMLHKTGEQVYKGLAGLFYIDDEVTKKLNIPKDYGVNDIPLVVQDKRLTRDGKMPYELGMRDIMHGMLGNTILVNGAINPYLDVSTVKMRFRLLNGSNARTYNFKLNNNDAFYQIATDGGLLEKPVRLSNIVLSPGERAEIIIDFSKYKIGDKLSLMDDDNKIIDFKVKQSKIDTTELPNQLTTTEKIPESEAVGVRYFEFRGMGPSVNINGKQMNMDRIDEYVKLNTTEIWEISNSAMGMMGGMIHPFHVHGVQFQILERNGNAPLEYERGWKDTILVATGDRVRAIARFKHKGVFMYHCHILEHEDAGMMGQYLVREDEE